MNYKHPDPITDSDGKDDFTEGKSYEESLEQVPQPRTVHEILFSGGSFWQKAKQLVVDTSLGRNTVGRVVGIGLDLVGFVFPRMDSIRRKGKRLLGQDQRTFKYQPQQQHSMDWLVNRLQERSTWRGLITAITGLGVVTLGEELRGAIITAGVSLFALMEVILKEPQSKDSK